MVTRANSIMLASLIATLAVYINMSMAGNSASIAPTAVHSTLSPPPPAKLEEMNTVVS